ncbi:Fc.00g018290.m01.CDS01 [Cosmosporella sp. VM-42]
MPQSTTSSLEVHLGKDCHCCGARQASSTAKAVINSCYEGLPVSSTAEQKRDEESERIQEFMKNPKHSGHVRSPSVTDRLFVLTSP